MAYLGRVKADVQAKVKVDVENKYIVIASAFFSGAAQFVLIKNRIMNGTGCGQTAQVKTKLDGQDETQGIGWGQRMDRCAIMVAVMI